MKANELRIGNLIEAQLPDGPYFNCKADADLLQTFSRYPDAQEYYKPIPLTEDWLLKFGFVEEGYLKHITGDVEYNHKDFYGNGLVFRKDGWFLLDYELNEVNDVPIKYVHQLQNLFYALMGILAPEATT